MSNLKVLWLGLFLFGAANLVPNEANAQRDRIPGRSDNFGIPSIPSIPTGPTIPSMPTFPSDLGRPGGIGGQGGLSGLPEYEFTCSNCKRVVATGTSRFSADHITKCPHCGVRFSNAFGFSSDASSKPNSARSPARVPARQNQGMSGQQARRNVEFSGLLIVAGFGFFLSIVLVVGGVIFYLIKDSQKRSYRYSSYGHSPYGPSPYVPPPNNGGATYQPPVQQGEPWSNPYKRS